MRTIKYLKQFDKSIEIIDFNSEVLMNTKMPTYWKDVIQFPRRRKQIVLEQWKKFPYQFELTTKHLENKLIDISFVLEKGEVAMLYTIKYKLFKNIYYIGYNPLNQVSSSFFNRLPLSFQDVYNQLHNGWVYFASKSNGLEPLQNIRFLSHTEWGVIENGTVKTDALPFKLENSIGLFNNGLGDYASINLEDRDQKKGFVWWHNKPPMIDVEIWAIIDEWTTIGMEK